MAIVDLLIRLKDNASSGLAKIGGALSGLGTRAQSAATNTQGLAGAFTQGILQANAIQFAIGKATEAIGFMNSKFEEAKKLQLANVTAATTFSSLTGQSYQDAAKFIENLNNRLAKSAAALPGATQDYKSLAIAVQDNVLEAFKDPAGKLNQEGFEDTLASISESFGALSAASNTPIGNTTLGLSKALGGASTAELRQIQFFEQNAVILNEIDKRLQAMGKSALKDLNIKERVKLLEDVGKKFITEDFKREAGGTVDALIQAYQSSLFDPSAGLFGLMRDIDPKMEGVQSAFSAINENLAALIGPQGLSTQIGGLLKALGLTSDPMAQLRRGILFATSVVKGVNAQVQYLADVVNDYKTIFKKGSLSLTKIGYSVQQTIGMFLDKIPGQIFSRYNPQKFAGLGQKFGEKVGEALIKAIGFAALNVANLDWLAIGRAAWTVAKNLVSLLGGVAQGIASGISSQLTGVDLNINPTVVSGAAAAAGGFILLKSGLLDATVSLGRFAFTAGGSAVGAIASLGNALKLATLNVVGFARMMPTLIGFAWARLATGISSVTLALKGFSLAGMWSAITTGMAAAGGAIASFSGTVATAGLALMTNPIVLGIGAIALAAGLIYKYWHPITEFFKGFASGLGKSLGPIAPLFASLGQLISATVAPAITLIADGVKNLIRFFGDLLKPVQDTTGASKNLGETLGVIVGGSITKVVQLLQGMIDFIGKGASAFTGFISGVKNIPGIGGFFSGIPTPTPVGYQGHIPTAQGGSLGGLLQAASTESKAMPSGAGLIMANTSETIIPRGMLAPVVQAIANQQPLTATVAATPANAGTTKNLIIQPGAIAINGANQSLDAIADAVVARIQQAFEGELEAQLG